MTGSDPALDALVQALPAIDEHLHPPLRLPQPRDEAALLSLFTESREPAQWPHVAHTVYYQQALDLLAEWYGCAPMAALLAARQAQDDATLLARCIGGANVRALLVDDGYQRPDSLTLHELRALAPPSCMVRGVLRIETLVERMLPLHAALESAEAAFDTAVEGARAQGYVALKSIAAYRTGLALAPADRAAALAAWPRLHAAARAGTTRLQDKAVLEHFLWRAVALAREQSLPLQLHTGFGDSDLDLRQADPLLLRPALESGQFAGVPLVLLHVYPYLRQAGYLASLYSLVCVDLSLTVPMVGPAAPRVLQEVLELAPASKVLYGSDAAGFAESIWLGARAMRRALAVTIGDWVGRGELLASRAEAMAARILADNAATLYDLWPR